MPRDAERRTPRSLVLVRVGLPAALAVAGVAVLALAAVVGSEVAVGVGILLTGGALVVILANLFIRLSLRSEQDREEEAAARRFFTRHGRWPRDRDELRRDAERGESSR